MSIIILSLTYPLSHVLSGDGGCGNRIIVLYHAHLLSSESVLIIQSVLEQNDGDLSIWLTSELPTPLRIRDWFIEVPTEGIDRNFEHFKKVVKEQPHNWDEIFHNKLLSWTKYKPNLNEVSDIKRFVYEILTRNLRWVECVHFLFKLYL